MKIVTNLPPGYSTVEDAEFVYLLHRGEEVARFSASGATEEDIEMEAYGQLAGDDVLLRHEGMPTRLGPDFRKFASLAISATSGNETSPQVPEKCFYDHLRDLFDEAGFLSVRRTYWETLIEHAVAVEFGECTEALEDYAAANLAEFLADEETWLGFTDVEDDPHPERRCG